MSLPPRSPAGAGRSRVADRLPDLMDYGGVAGAFPHSRDDPGTHSAGGARAELILSAGLALIVAGVSTYLVLA